MPSNVAIGTQPTCKQRRHKSAFEGIVLQNSQNAVRLNFR
jgi:hypothetical protein